MTATTQTWSEESITVAGVGLQLLKGGSGDPLLVLHHDIGNPGWLPVYETLARQFTVMVPSHPGYGRSQRAEWMRSVRDLAVVYQWLLAEMKVDAPALLGLGFGGWVAAEMATMAPRGLARLVLVGAMGLKPERGEILDQALLSHMDYVKAGFHDPAAFDTAFGAEPDTDLLEQWDANREMTFRIAWKPYMYSPMLPHLLGGVQAPALVVWGTDDRVVPLECGERYARALPNARLEVIPGCGHFVEMEKPDELAALVNAFRG